MTDKPKRCEAAVPRNSANNWKGGYFQCTKLAYAIRDGHHICKTHARQIAPFFPKEYRHDD